MISYRFLLTGFLLWGWLSAARGATLNHGFDPVRLGRLDAVIQDNINQHQLAGAVMFIARDGQTVHLKAYGQQDI
ncbi:MAG: hypothetical protein WCJ10_05455, partial [Opitutaceae bacterium]